MSLLNSCSTARPDATTANATSNATPAVVTAQLTAVQQTAEPVLLFEKTPCFGPCPVYKATIYADGRVQYEGEQNVPLIGKHALRLPADTVTYIRRQAESMGFGSLRSAYSQNVTDLPSTYLTLRQPDGSLKEVRVEGGAPAELEKLLAYIHRHIKQIAVAKN
ncbi:hypothetical protein FY528_19830 [Hymenobacter lutimineralis]|uniref:DUF6438 domain-containing protein n=1 Tax=Hymenobacter lutimineralis TaxID=2606448 RepID=A0A5D6USQ4_9BACT|nr:DUF6438 domain-containing protein [Hymenobacter lutimineralis]TYZ06015.1 hypothetical protein FY528_19830 [Hymenobacter lutimineralis]